MLHSLHLWFFSGPAALCFFAKRKLKPFLDLLRKLGQFVQYNIPPLQRLLCRDRWRFLTEVPHSPQVTLIFWSKQGLVGDF